MSLTACIKKAGPHLSGENKAAILAGARQHRSAGMGAVEAGLMAIDAQIETVQTLLKSQANNSAPEYATNQTQGNADTEQDATESVVDTRLGRDNVALSEGGKPYKTKLAAANAKKQQPMMRVVAVEGGFALAEKTPAQMAAGEKAGKRLGLPSTSSKSQPMPAHARIAADGGLHKSTRADLGIEGNPRVGNRWLFASKHGGGLTMEAATEKLKEDGYLSQDAGHNEARAIIKRSLSEPQYTTDGFERIAETNVTAQYQDYLAAQQEEALTSDFDPFETVAELGYTLDEAENAGYNAATDPIRLEVNALLLQAEAIGIDVNLIKEKAYEDTRNGSEQDYLETARAALQEAITRSASHRSQDAGRPGDAASQEVDAKVVTNAGNRSGNELGDSRRTGGADDVVSSFAVRPSSIDPDGTFADKQINLSAALEFAPKADGTLSVKGDAVAIRKALKDIPAKSMTAMKGGVLVGKTQADKAAAILNGETPKVTAREAAEAGQAARNADKKAKASAARVKPATEGLSIGFMPNNAEPVTVKGGVVYVGKYPAQDYDTAGDVTVPDGATDEQIVQALRDAGVIAKRQRVFGLGKLEATDTLTSPTKDDILDQQQRIADGDKADTKAKADTDKKAKADREAAEIKQAGATAADRFILGGNANDELSGQKPMFSRAAPGQLGQSTESIEQIVQEIIARWANAPQVVVAQDMTDARIPPEVRAADLEQRSGGAEGDPEGFFYKRKAYIIASQLKTPQDIARVLFHESLGHYGLRGTFGDALNPILKQLAVMRAGEVAAKAKDYGMDMRKQADRLIAAEEVLAEMAQTRPEMGFVKRAIAAVRAWLRENVPGFKNMALTDADIIANYILPARGWVERGRQGNMFAMKPAFSRAVKDVDKAVAPDEAISGGDSTQSTAPIAQTDTPAFKKWFGNSKVIDAQGKPLVVYHGTAGDFNAFDPKKVGSNYKQDKKGFFFVANSKEAGWAADDAAEKGGSANIMPMYIRISNPLEITVPQGKGFSASAYFDNSSKQDILARVKKEKRDGIIIRGRGDDLIFIAFDPEQMKSAIGNNGDFDSANPDIRFSRSSSIKDALSNAANNIKDVKLHAGYQVGDFFNGTASTGKLGWWHKSIGTMYNLAQREPLFKPVYDGVQNFLNDVSYYATEAADLAPNILPKLDTWKDITKTPLSVADSKAIAAPIFEGTLAWARDENGKAVRVEVLQEKADKLDPAQKAQEMLKQRKIKPAVLKMWQGLPLDQYETLVKSRYDNQMLAEGVVFTPDELKQLFNLNDKQIKLYQEFRRAIDQSLTTLAISDMVRYGGVDVESIADIAMEAKTVEDASAMLRDYLLSLSTGSDRKEVLIDMANTIIDKAAKARGLINKGYAPLSRFGTHSVDVVDAKGDRVYFGLFESSAEAAKMARRMATLYPKATIRQRTTSEQAYKLFAGVSPETLELFGSMLGLETQGDSASAKAFQDYIKLARSNRSAMKRLIQRKGIAGFSEDPGRVLAGFVYSNARQASSGLHMGKIAQAVNDIPQGPGQLKDAALKLQDYIKNPQEEGQAIKGLLFAQYLGGSVASAMVNMTQPLTVTFPYLSQLGGVTKAAAQMRRAAADVMKKTTGDKALDDAIKLAEKLGIVAPQEVHQLMAQANGSGSLKTGDGTKSGDATAYANNKLTQLSFVWGKLFGSAEQFNRRLTFIAAYRTAVEQKIPNPAAFAEKTINETQFVYNKGSKPRWARGIVGGTLFTFKQYSVNYLELAHRMATHGGPEGKKAALLMVAVLMLMGGAGGLPFAKDAEDIADGIMQRLGYSFSAKQKRNEFLAGLLGEGAARFLDTGVSGLPGVPIDVSGRMGMGNLIPGTGLFTKKSSYTRDVMEVFGPAGDLVRRGFESANKLAAGDAAGAGNTMLPVAGRNLTKALDMANTGMYRDQGGKKVIDVDAYDVLAKAIGFQPNNVARVQDAGATAMNLIGQNKIRETEIADAWAIGLFEGDKAKIDKAREDIKQWNKNNPESRIKINMPQIIKRVRAMREDKVTRILKTAPREIKASVRRELEEKQ